MKRTKTRKSASKFLHGYSRPFFRVLFHVTAIRAVFRRDDSPLDCDMSRKKE